MMTLFPLCFLLLINWGESLTCKGKGELDIQETSETTTLLSFDVWEVSLHGITSHEDGVDMADISDHHWHYRGGWSLRAGVAHGRGLIESSSTSVPDTMAGGDFVEGSLRLGRIKASVGVTQSDSSAKFPVCSDQLGVLCQGPWELTDLIYEGQFGSNGELTGYGQSQIKRTNVMHTYIGQHTRGKLSGYGLETSKDSKYEGFWKDGYYSGLGLKVVSRVGRPKVSYQGVWSEGRPSGFGNMKEFSTGGALASDVWGLWVDGAMVTEFASCQAALSALPDVSWDCQEGFHAHVTSSDEDSILHATTWARKGRFGFNQAYEDRLSSPRLTCTRKTDNVRPKPFPEGDDTNDGSESPRYISQLADLADLADLEEDRPWLEMFGWIISASILAAGIRRQRHAELEGVECRACGERYPLLLQVHDDHSLCEECFDHSLVTPITTGFDIARFPLKCYLCQLYDGLENSNIDVEAVEDRLRRLADVANDRERFVRRFREHHVGNASPCIKDPCQGVCHLPVDHQGRAFAPSYRTRLTIARFSLVFVLIFVWILQRTAVKLSPILNNAAVTSGLLISQPPKRSDNRAISIIHRSKGYLPMLLIVLLLSVLGLEKSNTISVLCTSLLAQHLSYASGLHSFRQEWLKALIALSLAMSPPLLEWVSTLHFTNLLLVECSILLLLCRVHGRSQTMILEDRNLATEANMRLVCVREEANGDTIIDEAHAMCLRCGNEWLRADFHVNRESCDSRSIRDYWRRQLQREIERSEAVRETVAQQEATITRLEVQLEEANLRATELYLENQRAAHGENQQTEISQEMRLEEQRARVEEEMRLEEQRARVEEEMRLEEQRARVEEEMRLEEQRARVEEEAAALPAVRCPTCNRPIEKTEGCNHMTCDRRYGCGSHFCWTCGDLLQGDWGAHFPRGVYQPCQRG